MNITHDERQLIDNVVFWLRGALDKFTWSPDQWEAADDDCLALAEALTVSDNNLVSRAPKVPSEYRVVPRELNDDYITEVMYNYNRKRTSNYVTKEMVEEIYSNILYNRPRAAIDMEDRT
ncbi:hypothetical protein Xoosp13_136 [Xanthomonas phage Xoo-sp13]|nr:hypothetical protein Xoosp13_136 [Xanthomonas phage Xoo-sp13]